MEAPSFAIADGVGLRPVRTEDVDELYALTVANRRHLARWLPWAVDPSPEATRGYVSGALAQRERQDGFQTVIVAEGAIVGSLGFHRIDWANRSTSVGYWIAASHQGAGIVTAGVRALAGHAFGPWELHRVELLAAIDNARSRAVAERLGFTQEGVRRGAERFGDHYRDLVAYSLLASDPRL